MSGKNGVTISVVTAYWVLQVSMPLNGDLTTYQQEHMMMSKKDITSPNPRKQELIIDITRFIQDQQSQGRYSSNAGR